MAKHFECGVITFLARVGIQVVHLRPSTTGIFVRFQSFEFSPQFYSIAGVTSPWTMNIRVRYVGKTSFMVENTLRCKETGAEFSRNYRHLVKVNMKERRPVKLPEEFNATFKPSANGSLVKMPDFPGEPTDSKRVFQTSFDAFLSDADYYHHINQANCFRYCMDCASLAAMKGGILTKFTRDMAYYNVKKFSAEYVGETNVGAIDVLCWENPEDPCVLFFLVKTGEKTVNRCQGEWHKSTDGSPTELTKNILSALAKANL